MLDPLRDCHCCEPIAGLALRGAVVLAVTCDTNGRPRITHGYWRVGWLATRRHPRCISCLIVKRPLVPPIMLAPSGTYHTPASVTRIRSRLPRCLRGPKWCRLGNRESSPGRQPARSSCQRLDEVSVMFVARVQYGALPEKSDQNLQVLGRRFLHVGKIVSNVLDFRGSTKNA